MSIYQSPEREEWTLPTHEVATRHGFVVVGERTLFLCHLANWWLEGHNWELVLRVTLPEGAKKQIINDRDDSEPHFLVNSALFTIPELIRRAWSLKANERKFAADIWKGFAKADKPDEPDPDWVPWDEHEPLLTDVPVKVDAVIHHRHANLNLIGRAYEEYLLFGVGGEAHIYHSPVHLPDYDHIATLAEVPAWIQQDQLETGVMVSVPVVPWFAGETHCEGPPLLVNQPTVVRFNGITDYRTRNWDGSPSPNRTVPRYEMTVKQNWWFATSTLNFEPPTRSECI